MKKLSAGIVLLVTLIATSSYDTVNNYEQIMVYYEEHSYLPIVHVYYNKHFKNSKQFQDFLQVVQETEYRNRDFSRFLMTDCDQIQEKQSQACDDMRRTKDNHAIVGYYPSGGFIKYAGKKMQNPPNSRHYKHPGDVYKVEELERFVGEMIPHFFEDIVSMSQFQQWLQPRYSPNLIFATREDDVPLVVSQLAVNYFLRFDMGYLNDLTEKVVAHLNITSFPALIVLKYNFELNTHELHKYSGKDFSEDSYEDIKAFLQPLALKQQRNDLLFHKMKPPKDVGIQTTDSAPELNQLLDRTNGWTFISQFKEKPAKLENLREKYGRFFEYVHFLNSSQEAEVISLYDPQSKKPITLRTDDVQWRPLSKDQFLSNMTTFLRKGFVVMGVREKYSHFCTLALSNFFKDLTFCFIIKDQDYEETHKSLGHPFEYGFICFQRLVDGANKVSGTSFNTDKYEQVYNTAQYQTRLKSKLIIDDFFQKPIKSIDTTQKIGQICNFPLKKCALLFSRSTKQDRTAYEYLKQVAKNFINEYHFVEIDLQCNPQFEKEIEYLQRASNGLVVYHPRQQTYVYLKAKLSRSTFQRFLQANLEEDKKLPHRKWKNEGITASPCKEDQKLSIKPKETEQPEVDQVVQL